MRRPSHAPTEVRHFRRSCLGVPDRRALRTPRYWLEPAANIRRSRYKSKTRGTTNTRPHQRPVAQSTTTTTMIQMASSSRITSDDFRCRKSEFTVVLGYGRRPRLREPEVPKSPPPRIPATPAHSQYARRICVVDQAKLAQVIVTSSGRGAEGRTVMFPVCPLPVNALGEPPERA